MIGQYCLSQFFDEDAITDLLHLAKTRIIEVFASERELARGKMRCTDNYIYGVAPEQSELARYIANNLKRKFITIEDVDDEIFDDVPPRHLDRLIWQLQHEAILLELNIMCSKPRFHIYWNERHGIWQIVQSVMDEFRDVCETARRLKVDNRHYHGRNRAQSMRRGTPAGVSVSMAR